jgi:hypothetical protein
MSSALEITSVQKQHLKWTSRQGYILTGGGKAEILYVPVRGFSFQSIDLPHHHLVAGTTHETFKQWRSSKAACSLVTGAWNRTIFTGGWDHTSDKDELVYNIQTHNLFIDMRIPRDRSETFPPGKHSSLEDLSPLELRLYARQHIFSGFSVFEEEAGRPLCTRHHCMDWNFVGAPRTRPNKWWIQMNEDKTKWKEYSFATDEIGQHYYFEQWELRGVENEPRLALRKSAGQGRDGIIVLVGNHFNYVLARTLRGGEDDYGQKSLVAIVDAAVAAGDLETARSYLSIEGGHGTVSSQWKLDCAIPPWQEGTKLWEKGDVSVEGDSISDCHVVWKGENWDVFDSSFQTVGDLKMFLADQLSG